MYPSEVPVGVRIDEDRDRRVLADVFQQSLAEDRFAAGERVVDRFADQIACGNALSVFELEIIARPVAVAASAEFDVIVEDVVVDRPDLFLHLPWRHVAAVTLELEHDAFLEFIDWHVGESSVLETEEPFVSVGDALRDRRGDVFQNDRLRSGGDERLFFALEVGEPLFFLEDRALKIERLFFRRRLLTRRAFERRVKLRRELNEAAIFEFRKICLTFERLGAFVRFHRRLLTRPHFLGELFELLNRRDVLFLRAALLDRFRVDRELRRLRFRAQAWRRRRALHARARDHDQNDENADKIRHDVKEGILSVLETTRVSRAAIVF